MKVAIDIGNSTIKGAFLTNEHELIDEILKPSAVNLINHEKYLSYHNNEIFFQIIDSPLQHFEEITCISKTALDRPNYIEYDVTSTSYKSDHKITTALLFGSIIEQINEDTNIKLAVSVPIVESKSLGLTERYQKLLEGKHKVIKYTKDDQQEITITIEKAQVLNEGQSGFYGLLDENDQTFQETMNHIYNLKGHDENPIYYFEDFLIVDIGDGTTDFAMFRGKNFNPEYSYSVTRGYGNLLEEAIKTAQKEDLTIESRKELQKLLTSTNKLRQKRKDMWLEYINPQIKEFVETVTDTILKAYGQKDYFDAIIFLGGGFTALTDYSIDYNKKTKDTNIQMSNSLLFDALETKMSKTKKDAGIIFGIPKPYAQTINERGLIQAVTIND